MTRKLSRAAMRRQRVALLDARANPTPLPAELTSRAENFVPSSLDEATWLPVRPVFLAVISRTSTRGADAFAKQCSALAGYLAWCAAEGLELDPATVMRFPLIDNYVAASRRSSTCRGRLRSAARDANPAGVPAQAITYPHTSVKAPYTAAEMAAIERVALNQPTAAQRRGMCAVVGLSRGAGLDSQDLRHLARPHVEDQGRDGIWVDVRGSRPRLVPVRRAWEPMVRIGLEGLSRNQLVIGTSTTRRNIAAKIVEKATILGSCPKIEASRLRTTWLADVLTADVPLAVVMAVSGLSSARTITEVLAHLDADIDAGAAR